MEIVEYVRKGQSSKEMAVFMGVALKTVEVHRHNILWKLQLKNSAALVNLIFGEDLSWCNHASLCCMQ